MHSQMITHTKTASTSSSAARDSLRGKGLLIVGCPGPSRRALFDAAGERGLRLFTVKGGATWEREFCEEVVDLTPSNYDDLSAIVDATLAMAARHAIDGILTPFDAAVPVMSEVGSALGLRVIDPRTAGVVRDKFKSRQRFAELGLPSARSVRVDGEAEALNAAADIGLPVVVKPTVGTGSVGVTRASTPREVTTAYATALRVASGMYHTTEVVVEEYLSGPEISVECVSFEGEVLFESVTDKPQPMSGPHFAEVEFMCPSQLSAEVLAQVYELNRRVLAALGLTHGVSHTEIRLTSRGPVLLEVNPRIAGQRVPHIVQQATGVDLMGAAIDVAMGVAPDLAARHGWYAGYRCVYPTRAGVLRSINGLDAARQAPGIYAVEVAMQPGAHLETLPHAIQENVAYVFGHGETYDYVRDATARAEALVHLEVD
jgi:biotin carboxylase